LNNATVNFAPQSIGQTLAPSPNTQVTSAATSNNGATQAVIANLLAPFTQGALAAPLAQGQPYDQFRLLAVNSQGQGNQPQVFQQIYFMGAFGFGSGTQPNQPWVPNAYNLGLANQQCAFPSQSDFGFQTPPPGYHPTAHLQRNDNGPDTDGREVPEALLVHETTEAKPVRTDRKTDNQSEEGRYPAEQQLPLEHPAARQDQLERNDDAVFDRDDTRVSEDTSIPDALWLSALGPVPLAALMTGLPAFPSPAEGGESGPAE
jgi:hypothetical protein